MFLLDRRTSGVRHIRFDNEEFLMDNLDVVGLICFCVLMVVFVMDYVGLLQ